MRRWGLALIASLVSGCLVTSEAADPAARGAVVAPTERPGLIAAFPELRFNRPVDLAIAPGRVFVAERGGRIWELHQEEGGWAASLALDLSSRVTVEAPDEGLLALATHPGFAQSPLVYVHYVAGGPSKRSVLSRFRLPDGAEDVLLEVEQLADGEKGGDLAFGPQGLLHVAVGSGGLGDPLGERDNLRSLLGKALRLDPEVVGLRTDYGVPLDNPYVGDRQGFREEILAAGFRNLRSITFDQAGHAWGLDSPPIGASSLVKLGRGTPSRLALTGGPAAGMVAYRGTRQPALTGALLVAEAETGRLWRVRPGEGAAIWRETGPAVAGLAEGPEGEPLILAADGWIYGLGE